MPIILSFLDYCKKEVGIGPVLNVTGDFETDFKKLRIITRNEKEIS